MSRDNLFSVHTVKRESADFQPTLDDDLYTIQVRWNLYGQRYYLLCADLSGNIIFNVPLIETEAGKPIEAMSWDVVTGLVTVMTTAPHGYAIGGIVALTLAGSSPDAYNGAYQVSIVTPDTFTFPLSTDPGAAMVFGQASYLISMTAGYFASTMIYRNGQFEVNP